jgi:thiosulfate/3-mercaptopyruvate sulfurtransferase
MISPLIDPQRLTEQLNRPDWVVIDCRFRLTRPEAGQALYEQGHIPGARYAHLDDDLAAPPQSNDGRHPLPNPKIFATTLERWGISNSSIVTVYDDASGAIAARLWWMLRWVGHESVFVLDGGIQAWEQAGLPLETAQPIWEPTEFLLHDVHEKWVVKADEILSEMEQGAILVDARSRDRFCGVSEPIDPVAGHVPGAVNYPFSKALNSAGYMRNSKELQQDLEVFAKTDRGLIAMCGSGVTACHLLLALKVAGLGDGRAYIGSWSQWIRHNNDLIATGDDFHTAPP